MGVPRGATEANGQAGGRLNVVVERREPPVLSHDQVNSSVVVKIRQGGTPAFADEADLDEAVSPEIR